MSVPRLSASTRLLGSLLIAALVAVLGVGAHRLSTTPTAAAQGQLREFTLVAEPVRWEIQPGLVVDGWGYNGSIPGPTLHVTEGDRVRVTLVNHLPVETTIHWHGIDVPVDQDGVPGLSQEPVEPGDTYVYEFTATNPGTRWYHSHVDSNLQIQLGLFGAFIIDPRQPEPVHYDRDYTYILSEKALDVTPAVALGEAQVKDAQFGNGRGGDFKPDLFLMNGRAGSAIDPVDVKQGERIRIRMINAGNLVHAMHTHGHSFKIIATDGNPVPPAAQLTKDTVLIGPAERYDVEIVANNPGVWMFHCHINNHMENGMVTEIAYEGSQPLAGDHLMDHGAPVAPPQTSAAPLPAPSTATAAGSNPVVAPPPPPAPSASAQPSSSPGTGASPQASPSPAGSAPPSALVSPAPSTSGAAGAPGVLSGNAVEIRMTDDRFTPSRTTVKAGSTVTWVQNGNNQHTTSSLNALWDSGLLDRGQTFSYTFDKPGTYQYICRQHLLQGMRGTITVEP